MDLLDIARGIRFDIEEAEKQEIEANRLVGKAEKEHRHSVSRTNDLLGALNIRVRNSNMIAINFMRQMVDVLSNESAKE